MIKKIGLENCKPIGTPMITGHKLSRNDETPLVEKKKYIYMTEGLKNLTHSRLDIANLVGIVARFQADHNEYHYVAVKRIFKYLKGTSDYGIWYDRGNDFTIYGSTDVDWVGSMDDRKSTSGGSFFLVED